MVDKTKEVIISINDLSCILGENVILEHLNLEVVKGEIMAIAGGSGSGKTTLLRSILMLLHPTEGSLKVFETDVLHSDDETLHRVRRRWGVLFQHSALFSALTVLENVQFPLRTFTHLPPKAQQDIALLKIAMAGLPLTAASKYPAELSGGMQKRAALARAIAMDPELLFLDEPSSGLDPKSAAAFDDLILDLRQGLGLTVVMVTHDLDALSYVADRVAFLGKGKVFATQPLTELIKEKDPMIQAYFAGHRAKRRLKRTKE